jgi:hypothetical protein
MLCLSGSEMNFIGLVVCIELHKRMRGREDWVGMQHVEGG